LSLFLEPKEAGFAAYALRTSCLLVLILEGHIATKRLEFCFHLLKDFGFGFARTE